MVKVNSLFPLAYKHAPEGQKRKYYEVLRDLLHARAELGYKNDINVVFDNIHEIFFYMTSDLDKAESKFYERVLNDVAKWLNKNITIEYDEFTVEHDDSDEDSDDEMDEDSDSDDESDEDSDSDGETVSDSSDDDSDVKYTTGVTVCDLDAAVDDIKNYIKKERWATWCLASIGYVLGAASYSAYMYYAMHRVW